MRAGWLAGLFAACFAAVVVATLPLSMALHALNFEGRGVSYARASGTVWDGEIEGLTWRGHDLGSVRLAVRPLPFLIGRLGFDLTLDGKGVISGKGYVALKPGGLVINDLALSADVATMPVVLPLNGVVALTLAHADLSAAGCREIEGGVRTDALVNRPAGLAWRGPVLEGPITCADGAVVIPLKGDTKTDSIAIAMTLGHDGSFGIRVEARTPDPGLVSVLSAVGFVETDGVMTLTQRGRWI